MRQQASQGHRHSEETHRTGGGAVGGSQEARRGSELVSRSISGRWPDQEGPHHELHNSASSASHGHRDEGFAWKQEDTTPQHPNQLLPDVAKAAHVCPLTSAPSWWEKLGKAI